VLAGGTETIVAGGTAVATVLSGGLEADSGQASGTTIRAGGQEVVHALATASGSVISSGGTELVSSGGKAVGAIVSGGGLLTVASGGVISGGVTLRGGVAIVSGTMASGQTVSFAATSGTLELANLSSFHAKISGLTTSADKIDLLGFAFTSGETVTWTQSGTSGTLAVKDGAKTASLSLIGAYATSDFTLAKDGHGGTFVTDPPAPDAAPATTLFTQAAAGLGAHGQGVASVHSGGAAMNVASSLVTAATSGR
jgi:autotransporter passenger strand-loop-strand repeat protein